MEGFRIKRRWDRVAPELVAAFAELPVANVSDVMHRLTGAGALARVHRSGGLAGPAFTLRGPPGDNLMLHKAIDMARPGDVIVMDAGASLANAITGELMITHAQQRGIAGFVIDGAVRDRDALAEINLPVYARGICHRGPYKNGPGEIGYPVSVGGMLVRPGDLMLGDGDGLLCVPPEGAEAVLERARAKAAAEAAQMETTLAGGLDRGWVDRELEARGCRWED